MTDRVALQFKAAIRRRGTPVILRKVTKSGSPPMPNPPILVGGTVDGAVSPGSTTLSINASQAFGQILAGDRIILDGQQLTVTAPAVSRPNSPGTAGFDGIAFAPALLFGAGAGATLTFNWSADVCTWATIRGFPLRLVDGEMIKLGDLMLKMAHEECFDPQLSWKVIFDGNERTIINAQPAYVRGRVAAWDVHAR